MKFVSFLQKSQAKFGISDGKNITDRVERLGRLREWKNTFDRG